MKKKKTCQDFGTKLPFYENEIIILEIHVKNCVGSEILTSLQQFHGFWQKTGYSWSERHNLLWNSLWQEFHVCINSFCLPNPISMLESVTDTRCTQTMFESYR